MSPIHETRPVSLAADVLAQARAEAERHFGDGPAPVWRPSSTPEERRGARRRRALWVVASSCAALAALVAGVGGWAGDERRPPEAPRLPSEPADDTVVAATPVPTRVAPTRPASSTLSITRRGGEWRIEAVGVSRLVAAQRLAQASGSRLLGDIEPLAAARPLDLRWQGRDPASAWQAVLGPGVSFAMQCGAVRCRVWIVEPGARGPGPAPAHRAPPQPPSAAPMIAAVAATAPAPGDSSDPRIAAHHD